MARPKEFLIRPDAGDWRLTRRLEGVDQDRTLIPAWRVDLARRAGLPLIGRARGRRFIAPGGEGRIVFDSGPETSPRNPARRGARGHPMTKIGRAHV